MIQPLSVSKPESVQTGQRDPALCWVRFAIFNYPSRSRVVSTDTLRGDVTGFMRLIRSLNLMILLLLTCNVSARWLLRCFRNSPMRISSPGCVEQEFKDFGETFARIDKPKTEATIDSWGRYKGRILLLKEALSLPQTALASSLPPLFLCGS
jgi:hypothetical protein